MNQLAKLDMLVVELRDRETCFKKLVVEEFKSSKDFQEVVKMTTSKYFSEGFDF